MQKSLPIFLLFLLPFALNAQTGSKRTFEVSAAKDSIKLDTLSIIPSSFRVEFTNGFELDSALYKLDWGTATLILRKTKWRANIPETQAIKVEYEVFPYNFSKEYYNKSIDSLLKPQTKGVPNPFAVTIDKNTADDIFSMSTLNKNGSISRGLTVGNNQDVAISSSLNLQLSGNISENIGILAAITDNNIPIQPEGNTQQLQDFDQVYIQIFTDSTKLTAGDFQLRKPEGYFMNFYKRAQGLSVSHAFGLVNTTDPKKKIPRMRVTGSGAISRGKFARNIIQGVESNQGPYRLRGNENELFIIVLAGTENVYIDGQLMVRGQENDYVIDYNTAEVTFTPKQIITKDRRIIVEFQYSDKNYARSLFHFGDEFEYNKLKLRFNFYSEQDSKNQPLLQDLDDARKQILTDVGDSLQLAVVPSVTEEEFNNEQVFYELKDSTIAIKGNTRTYDSIFVYSTNPQKAKYQLRFSDVGQGNGNYRQVTSSANGKVFQWFQPDTVTGILQGNYEPVEILIAPKLNQMFSLGGDYMFSENAKLTLEGAITNTDLNRFSGINSDDDIGYAGRLVYNHIIPIGKKDSLLDKRWKILTGLSYEHTDKNFRFIERFRTVEFDRDWNLRDQTKVEPQHITGGKLGFSKYGIGEMVYGVNSFINGNSFSALQNTLSANIAYRGFKLDFRGSLINSNGTEKDFSYKKYIGTLSKTIRWFMLGIRDEFEDNRSFINASDSLLTSSFYFSDRTYFVQNSDTAKNKFNISYRRRMEKLPQQNDLDKATVGENIAFTTELGKSQNSRFKSSITYRKLTILDSLLTTQRADNSLISRLEYTFGLFKGAVTSTTFYEIGSGLEAKKEFSYIGVTNGQGPYIWIDYNDNGIKELNEFEINPFPNTTDTTYLRVFVPTNDYVKTHSNAFNEVFNINPSLVWASKTGIRKFLSRFANQFVYRIDRKTQRDKIEKIFNPFETEIADTSLLTLNSSFRNTFFFNRSSAKFGVDYTWQDTRSKILLTNGFDSRSNASNGFRSRWNITRMFTLNITYNNGTKASTSEYFNTNNFIINYNETEPKLSFQPNTAFRMSIQFKYMEKRNNIDYGGEKTFIRNAGTELKYNILSKGSILANFNYIINSFNGAENSPLGFEMLEGLKVGQNFTWALSGQTKLNKNMQLNIQYTGRKSEGSKTIHTGNVQVRAFF